jgi:hypothetical protein
VTEAPVEAATSATPLPMMPDPTIPIFWNLINEGYRYWSVGHR